MAKATDKTGTQKQVRKVNVEFSAAQPKPEKVLVEVVDVPVQPQKISVQVMAEASANAILTGYRAAGSAHKKVLKAQVEAIRRLNINNVRPGKAGAK